MQSTLFPLEITDFLPTIVVVLTTMVGVFPFNGAYTAGGYIWIVSWWKKERWPCFCGIQWSPFWNLLAIIRVEKFFWFSSFIYISKISQPWVLKVTFGHELVYHVDVLYSWILRSASCLIKSSSSASPLDDLTSLESRKPISLFPSFPFSLRGTGSSPSTQASPSSSSGSLPGWGPDPHPSSSSFLLRPEDSSCWVPSPSEALLFLKTPKIVPLLPLFDVPAFSCCFCCKLCRSSFVLIVNHHIPLPSAVLYKGGRICGKLMNLPHLFGVLYGLLRFVYEDLIL